MLLTQPSGAHVCRQDEGGEWIFLSMVLLNNFQMLQTLMKLWENRIFENSKMMLGEEDDLRLSSLSHKHFHELQLDVHLLLRLFR